MTVPGYRDGFVRARGMDFHYLDRGDPASPTLVMLHNTTGNAHRWDPIAAVLASDWRCIALDARNHGDSDISHEPADWFVLAEDLAAIVDALGLGRFGLIGHSLGGRTALVYAGQHPGRLDWLVIEDMAPSAPAAGADRMAAYLAALPETYASLDAYIAEYLRPSVRHASDAELRERALYARVPLPGGGIRLKYHPWPRPADDQSEAIWDLAALIDCPSLLIWGHDSDIISPPILARLAATIPQFAEAGVAGAGHSVHLDQPVAFLAKLLPFLAAQRSADPQPPGEG